MTLPVTLELVLWAFLLALVLAIPLGVLSAYFEDRWIDHLSRAVAVIGVSIPTFWLGLMLIAWFAVGLRWFPAGGYVPWSAGVGPHLASLTLPAVALGLYYVAIISRMTRSSVADVLMADHVRVARAMGLPRRRILGNDRPGPVSLRLKELYWQRHREGWHATPVRSLNETDAIPGATSAPP